MSGKCRQLTAIDLFSGCGGLSLGLRAAGFRVLAAVENDPLASHTYRLNHPDTVVLDRDITRIRPQYLRRRLGLRPGELTLLAGCPPCQGFSSLRTLNGRREIVDPMNDLIFQFLKFVRAFLPQAIMMENVPGLIEDPRLRSFRKSISALGYQSDARVLDAADFGTPQRRRRMVLIAMKDATPSFPEKTKYRKTVRWALSKLSNERLATDPVHIYDVRHSDHVLELIRNIPPDGGSRSDLPSEKQLACHIRCDGFSDVYGRMSWRRPAPTITGGCINPSKGRFLHPIEHRAITLREAAVLQGFPVTYQFDLSRGRYPTAQMIGNAFPPKFAELHAKAIRAQLRG
jgi:DNA (cytosine-5)-methyltransferase 1